MSHWLLCEFVFFIDNYCLIIFIFFGVVLLVNVNIYVYSNRLKILYSNYQNVVITTHEENPIERVWRVTNERVRNTVVFKTCSEFKNKIHAFYNLTWDTIASELRGRINDNVHTLKPVF